jgi:predicted AlkP superfamily phosphohydrolase/phosphomutase
MNEERGTRNTGRRYSRREFLAASAGAALCIGAPAFPSVVRPGSGIRRMIVLGIDGMDPTLLGKYMQEGLLPNFRRLSDSGCFYRLRTSDPPQSPVAWSNFISGTNPGGHGIFDFIARDASTITPYLSTARTYEPRHSLQLGKFSLPLEAPRVKLLRQGPTLWDILQEAGVNATACRAPVCFPAADRGARTLSGITTPDIHGSYGVFTLFTSDPGAVSRPVPGGRIERVAVRGDAAAGLLQGPTNTFHRSRDKVGVEVTIERDPENPAAVVTVGGRRLLLREGEWSEWVTIGFTLLPLAAETSGICRFYLKRVRPHLELYASPVNIDPRDPAMPISSPASYSRELADQLGLFYTQGMAEDTSALKAGVFSDEEFRVQSTFVLEENLRMYRHELGRFREGFFYYYFSSLDLNSHAFWRCIDTGHPLYTPELARRHGDFLPWIYGRMDEALGDAMKTADERTLVLVVSDHGFVPFRRQFNLNSWLMDNGYAKAVNPRLRGHTSFFQDTDWTGTRAYGLGINSLYLNLKGREPEGNVAPGDEAESLCQELRERLTSVRDPKTGEPVIVAVYRPADIYSGPCVVMAPDLVVGYNRNYRASWDTILGSYPAEHLLDNLEPWSGDHCMDARFLPGVLLCNRPLPGAAPAMTDMAPTILDAFGLPAAREMTGHNLFEEGPAHV